MRNHLKRRIELINPRPLMSIVMASYNPDHRFFKEAIDSVLDQYYENFELLIADDCSPDAEVRAIVETYAKKDSRVRLVRRETNGGISAATNSAIAQATGDWLVFMDHDDTLVPHALLHVVLAIQEHPQATLIYSDEDKINEANEPFTPYFKSDFDPLLLLGQNYVSHLTTIRRDLVAEVGGLRSEFDGSQDWDLVLRVTERVPRSSIIHIPHVLYHWRSHAGSTSLATEAKPWAVDAGRRAVADALERRGVKGEVRRVPGSGFNRVVFALPENPPLVSVLIPTRDGKYLADCLQSLLDKTTYPNFEVVVIDNGSVKPFTQAMFHVLSDKITVVRDDSPFNYSALHNRAVPSCEGDILLLLNDDTEIIDGDWMTHMVAQLLQPGVGAVGAKLALPRRSHPTRRRPARSPGPRLARRAVPTRRRHGVLRAHRTGLGVPGGHRGLPRGAPSHLGGRRRTRREPQGRLQRHRLLPSRAGRGSQGDLHATGAAAALRIRLAR